MAYKSPLESCISHPSQDKVNVFATLDEVKKAVAKAKQSGYCKGCQSNGHFDEDCRKQGNSPMSEHVKKRKAAVEQKTKEEFNQKATKRQRQIKSPSTTPTRIPRLFTLVPSSLRNNQLTLWMPLRCPQMLLNLRGITTTLILEQVDISAVMRLPSPLLLSANDTPSQMPPDYFKRFRLQLADMKAKIKTPQHPFPRCLPV